MMVDYFKSYWCTAYGHSVKKTEAKTNKENQPICPTHGQRLRTRSRQGRRIKQ